ncbi:MAG: tetratricopeptide repeat protein [Anaerolineae bacterium]
MSHSLTRAVAQVLAATDRPLTVNEILARVVQLPLATAAPDVAGIRSTFINLPLVASVGGRPARYVWWPHRLAGSTFRLPLAAADPAVGPWPLGEELFLALWPTFFAERISAPHTLTFVLPDGTAADAEIDLVRLAGPVRPGERPSVWSLFPGPALTAWLRHEAVEPNVALRIQAVDVPGRRYAVQLIRPSQRDEAALAARNRALVEAAIEVLRAGREDMPDFYLVPRLIARDAYRDPLPPDPLAEVLKADLRIIVGKYNSIFLAAKVVDAAERQTGATRWFEGAPRPAGQRQRAQTEDQRRAWAEYLFDQGMEYLWSGLQLEAEAYYREALCLDPGHADAWVHLGNLYFNAGQVTDALACYERGEAAALARTIGNPDTYEGPFWLDLDSRPYLRALHGKGCCYWRLGRTAEARRVFAQMLRLNPNDNQGARFLLAALDAGRTWEEEVAREEQEAKRGRS